MYILNLLVLLVLLLLGTEDSEGPTAKKNSVP